MKLMLISFLVTTAGGSLFSPHVFPKAGPFFEGWYLRITDYDSQDSIGALFGQVLRQSTSNAPSGPPVLAAVLTRYCGTESCTLRSYSANFSSKQLSVTVNGEPVRSNPDVTSPANFRWTVKSTECNVLFDQLPNVTRFNFELENLVLRGEAGPALLWTQNGEGPEGWLGYLPLPLHWFVYSLRSPLHFYELRDRSTGRLIRGENGVVHMEKNWGKSFPKSWIWSEGLSRDGKNISYAVSGGRIGLSFISIEAYLIGYRNPGLGLSVDFRPDNSFVSSQINGCSGKVVLTARSVFYKVTMTLSGDSQTFSDCLYGPEKNGFRKACVESYDAAADIIVSVRSGIYYKTIDKQQLSKTGLEFGGTHVCKNKCG